MARQYARSVVTIDDYSSIPFIISCLVVITNVLAVAAKIATKLLMSRRLGTDDATITISLLFSIGMVISTCLAAEAGLGKAQSTLDYTQSARVAKLTYASDLLYILTLFFSKASMLIIIKSLTPFGGPVRAVWAIAAVLVGWTITSFFVTAFQCSVPQVWNTVDGKCLNLRAFWTYFDVMNILLEIGASILPIMVIYRVQIANDRKRVIMVVFLLRVVILAPLIAGIYYRQQTVQLQNDPTLAQWPITICMQLVQCLSIVFACVPFLKPFFESLETGMVRLDDTRRLASRTTTFSSETGGVKSPREASRQISHQGSQNWTNVSSGRKSTTEAVQPVSSSSSGTTANQIYTTTTFSVVEEADGEKDRITGINAEN